MGKQWEEQKGGTIEGEKSRGWGQRQQQSNIAKEAVGEHDR